MYQMRALFHQNPLSRRCLKAAGDVQKTLRAHQTLRVTYRRRYPTHARNATQALTSPSAGRTSLPMHATSTLHRCCARLRASGCMGKQAHGHCVGRGRWRGFGRQPSSSELEVERGGAAFGGVGERALSRVVEVVDSQTACKGREAMRAWLLGGGFVQSMRSEDQSPEKGGGVRPERSRRSKASGRSGRSGASSASRERARLERARKRVHLERV